MAKNEYGHAEASNDQSNHSADTQLCEIQDYGKRPRQAGMLKQPWSKLRQVTDSTRGSAWFGPEPQQG